MSKILVFSTFALVLIFAGAFSFATPAQASQYCANGSTMTGQEVANAVSAGALSFTWSDNSGQMTVHVNNTTNCSVPLTLASYKMFQEPGTSGWLSSQQFYAESPLTNATPNSITNISVSTPSCKVQVDLWYQTAPHQLLDSDPYHNPNALPYVISAASTLTPLCVACTSHTTKQCVGSSVYWFNSCGTQEDLYQACTSGQTCQNGQCVNTCTPNTTKQCVGNSVYWYDSCGTQGSLFQTCDANQTCSNGACQTNQCVPLTCNSYNNVALNKTATATAGNTLGYEPSKAVDGNPLTSWNTNPYVADANPATLTIDLQQEYSTSGYSLKCEGAFGGNSGTIYFYNAANQIVQTKNYSGCSYSNLIQGNFASATNVRKAVISAYSAGDNVSVSEFALFGTEPACGNHSDGCGGQLSCGACPVNITCSTNSQCGTDGYVNSPTCQNGNVYQDYKTWTCSNAGTAQSACSSAIASQLKTTCTSGQTCSSGSCITQNILCSSNSDCGTSGYINSPFCQGGNVYQDYKTWICNNAGTPQSSCSNTTVAQLKTTCSSGQTCTNGSCTAVLCSSNSDCGASGYSGSQYCQGNSIYRNYITYTCNNPGTPQSSCSNHTDNQLYQACTGNQTCQNGSCSGQSCTYHSYQQCSGNYLYWYDSCGVQQDSTYCPNGCSNNACQGGGSSGCQNCSLTLNKTVKNLTSGNSGFVNSAYANPGDTLMFMITLLANGNQNVQNVFVKDYFPSNLIYQNQLIISGSNYTTSGNIISGISLGTINAGQTVTITYQAQVAPAQNFNYGTTTLSNSVTATSSGAASTPSASASVVVTRTAVLAASVISTGLTNNFLVDSFLLPLALALLGIWMLKSGMLFGVEKWISQKRRVRRDFKAEKELIKKIETIKTREVA